MAPVPASTRGYTCLEEYDSRVSLFADDAFQSGLVFAARFIGACEVPRPQARVEIVAAMRRVRFDFKAKDVKKRKVSLTVSLEGRLVSVPPSCHPASWLLAQASVSPHILRRRETERWMSVMTDARGDCLTLSFHRNRAA